jgi:hypothetical protein
MRKKEWVLQSRIRRVEVGNSFQAPTVQSKDNISRLSDNRPREYERNLVDSWKVVHTTVGARSETKSDLIVDIIPVRLQNLVCMPV